MVILVLLTLAGLAGAAVWSLYQGIIRFNYPSLADYPVQGIDVSHHQGRIDWAKLKAPHVRFAYIKASEGGTFRDPMFAANWAGARGAGIVAGAYHFFTFCKSGAEQAANFLAVFAERSAQLPPAIDLEFGGNCGQRPSKAAFEQQLRDFLVELERRMGCRPLLYVTQEFYQAYVAGSFNDYALWVRNIYRRPVLHAEERWILWQYANRARLPGVATFIDLNAFSGTAAEFGKLHCIPLSAA